MTTERDAHTRRHNLTIRQIDMIEINALSRNHDVEKLSNSKRKESKRK